MDGRAQISLEGINGNSLIVIAFGSTRSEALP